MERFVVGGLKKADMVQHAGCRIIGNQLAEKLIGLRHFDQPDFPVAVLETFGKDPEAFEFGDKSVRFDLLELHVRERVFPLTLMETNLLRYLIRHEGRPVSRKAMLEEVWGLHEDTDTRAIDNFIVRLRRYVEDDPTKPRHLLTVRGVGYRFVAAPAKDS